MTFPHQPGLASSPWPPTPTPIPEGWLSGHGHGEFLPSTAIRSRRGADVHSQGGQAPGLGRDPRGCPLPAQPSKGGEAWEPGPWRDQHKARRAAIGSWQEEKTFFFFFLLLQTAERKTAWPLDRPTPASLQGAENKTLFSSRSWNLLPGQATGWFFPSSLGTRRCVHQSCPGPLRESPE